MSHVQRMPRSHTQLDLFTPRPNIPRWNSLPRATRQTIKTHLATMIRQRAARLRRGREADDER
jgi:hypothetical protein